MLSIIDIRFGILGLACMGVPLYLALSGRGKIHCSKYCPRGSLLGTFLKNISLQNNLPKFLRTKTIKNIMLIWMVGMFSISLYMAGGDLIKTGYAIFRMMLISSLMGVILGILFKPRSWCQVCPMGYATGLIEKSKKADKANKINKTNKIKNVA